MTLTKKFLIIFCFLLSYFNKKATCQIKNIDLEIESYNVKGSIKAIREYSLRYEAKFGDYIEREYKDKPVIFKFDKNKNLVLKMVFDDEPTIYNYDDKNNLLEINRYTLEQENRKSYMIYQFNLNKNWDTLNCESYLNEKRLSEVDSKVKFKYYGDNKLMEEDDYSNSGALVSKYVYYYNHMGDISKVQNYNKDLSLGHLDKYTYDIKNNLITVTKETGIIRYAYDIIQGTKTESVYQISELSRRNQIKLTLTDRKVYNNKNQLIKAITYDGIINPIPSRIESYKYDVNGNEITRIIKSDSNNEILSTKYDYDINGNWIKMSFYINGIPKNGARREIIYYK